MAEPHAYRSTGEKASNAAEMERVEPVGRTFTPARESTRSPVMSAFLPSCYTFQLGVVGLG